ncbi:hypothetical protein Forpe1208_v009601 [Fusarium oxysporum f. sp. rapae]|uniref:Uncharacterized protein n=1 Tax=Fusarium oxysporum f. sp. rapae TaxID=485398 RepID=A0A8J5U7A2_FUSOX|nr:hypothetical protein Forpe1208_v009601 [Fusarium oxysporum f. sp. rapae]
MNEYESVDTADEQEKIVSYVNGKQAGIHLLNEKEAEIVIPTKTSNEIFTADPCLNLIDRLNWIHQTTKAWRFVGYELYFIIKGEPEPNHGLNCCEQWPASKHAKRILQWLTTLKIPQYYNVRRACSMCGHGWLVYNKMGQGELAHRKARSQRSNSRKANLIKEYNTAPNPDGYYINKPAVHRIIAALYAYDNQILGKALTKMALDHEGIDLTSESQARLWLEQRIRSQDNYWVSRLIYVLDQLIMARTACRYLTIARDSIVLHRREAGNNTAEEPWIKVQLQTWIGGKHARYWIIRDDSDSNGPSDTANEADARSQSAMDEVIAASHARLKEEDVARLRKGDLKEDINRDSSIHDAAEWLRARAATGRWTVAQDDEEAVRERLLLGRLGQSFDREVERCCWRLDSVLTETLQWLASISSSTPSGQPFSCKGKEASMIKYKSVGHRYLGFCWKAYRIGRKEALERWAVCFTDEQWSLLQDIADELERDRVPSSHDSGFFSGREREATDKDENEDKDKDEYRDDDSDEDERGNEGMTSSLDGALDRAEFNFIVASIKTHVGGNVYTNSLLCFFAALGINRHPLGYLEPHLYTGMLAGILWWARLFFLEAVFENQPVDQDEVGVEAVLTFREEHTSWICTGTHSVISTIIGWMACGKGYRQKNGGQPSIRWSDDEEGLFHMGEHISINDFTRTLRDEVIEAEKLLNELFGGVLQTVSKKIDMGRIVDNMIRLGAGQSFA